MDTCKIKFEQFLTSQKSALYKFTVFGTYPAKKKQSVVQRLLASNMKKP